MSVSNELSPFPLQALSGLWSLLPMQYQSLSEAARQYTPGMEYMHYVQHLPAVCPTPQPSSGGGHGLPHPPNVNHGPPWLVEVDFTIA